MPKNKEEDRTIVGYGCVNHIGDDDQNCKNCVPFYEIDIVQIENLTSQGGDYFPKTVNPRLITLPIDSNERKSFPLLSGCLKYFGAALSGVARTSKLGNDKHNPGEELHHARGKSMDHGDCIIRHLMDIEDLLAARARGSDISDQQILDEAGSLCWRALAYSQELHERFGAPLAPGAKKPK